jgi:hypothetical protein
VDPAGTVALEGATSTVIAETVMVAEVTASGSATEAAVTATCKSFGGGPGAVYVVTAPLSVEVGETLPQGAGEHETDQVTPLLDESPTTLAVSCVVAVPIKVAVGGVRLIATEGTVTVAAADFVASTVEVAVNVSVSSFVGSVVGAV